MGPSKSWNMYWCHNSTSTLNSQFYKYRCLTTADFKLEAWSATRSGWIHNTRGLFRLKTTSPDCWVDLSWSVLDPTAKLGYCEHQLLQAGCTVILHCHYYMYKNRLILLCAWQVSSQWNPNWFGPTILPLSCRHIAWCQIVFVQCQSDRPLVEGRTVGRHNILNVNVLETLQPAPHFDFNHAAHSHLYVQYSCVIYNGSHP